MTDSSKKERKTEKIEIRVTKQQKEALYREAEKRGLRPTPYLLGVLLQTLVKDSNSASARRLSDVQAHVNHCLS